MILGLLLVGISIFLGGYSAIYFNLPSVMIVLGGVIATTLIRFTLKDVINSIKVAMNAFFGEDPRPESLIREMIKLSNISRREGILRLEKIPVQDPFLKKAIRFCVDGYEPSFIKDALEKDIEMMLQRHSLGQSIFTAMGETAPAFGMVGTLIGLVAMLAQMKDPSSIGPSMAVALLTTLYGALFAYLFALPVADKLRRRSIEEELSKRLVIEGILALNKGLHPAYIEELLSVFLPAAERKTPDQP